MNANKKTTIIIYGDYYDSVRKYDDSILGALFRKLLFYAKTNKILPDETTDDIKNATVNALFSMFKHYVDIDKRKYEATCEQNRKNILKRYGKGSPEVPP